MPPKQSFLSNNAVYISRKGYVNTRMAGGDQDGDLNFFTSCPWLLEVVKKTQTVVDVVCDVDLKDAREDLEKALGKDKTFFFFLGQVL
jgi:hypothetical protein